jgi:hypothetical protein
MAKMASLAAELTEIPPEYSIGFHDGVDHVVKLLRQLAKDFTLIEGENSHDAAYHNHLADVLEEENKWQS